MVPKSVTITGLGQVSMYTSANIQVSTNHTAIKTPAQNCSTEKDEE